MDIPFVFVHLGKNPSPQLTFMAVAAKKLNPSVELYLITDHPKFWQDFPGMLIVYRKRLLKILKVFSERIRFASIYVLHP